MLVPPYTFIATVNVVLLQHALPVFVDTDRETFQIDAKKIEERITPRTRCILPVHMGGASAEMDLILELARKHKLSVVEDACQSHLAEWRDQPVSTVGDIGCFSFQASKNLNCGEGGALITNNDELIARAERFHTNGGSVGKADNPIPHRTNGCNLRMTEFQGALLAAQYDRVEEQAREREDNAGYLTSLFDEIDGISPARMHEGCTRNAYHLYMFRYDPQAFAGLPREGFVKALRAEGVHCSTGYRPLNKDKFLEHTFQSRAFRSIYSDKELSDWRERNHHAGKRPVVQRGGLAHAEQAAWLPRRHGSDRRGGKEDPGVRSGNPQGGGWLKREKAVFRVSCFVIREKPYRPLCWSGLARRREQ